jgi:hypothetical protein
VAYTKARKSKTKGTRYVGYCPDADASRKATNSIEEFARKRFLPRIKITPKAKQTHKSHTAERQRGHRGQHGGHRPDEPDRGNESTTAGTPR